MRSLSASGAVLATADVAADGAYAFDAVAAGDDYRVDVDPADLPTGATATTATLPTATVGDVTAPDVTVTRTYAVTGDVTGSDVADLDVSLTPTAGGGGRTTTTRSTGAYAFAAVPPGSYTAAVAAQTGSQAVTASRDVTVGCAAVVVDPFVVSAASPVPGPPTNPPTTAPTTGDAPTTVSAGPTAGETAAGGVLAATGAGITGPAALC